MKTKTPPKKETTKFVKYFALLYLLLAIIDFYIRGLSWSLASGAIVGGLMMMLFSPEKIEDERVQHLKLKAISYGCCWGAVASMLYGSFAERVLGLERVPVLAANDALIFIMTVAIGCFHYWRWQDGREGGQKPNTVNH